MEMDENENNNDEDDEEEEVEEEGDRGAEPDFPVYKQMATSDPVQSVCPSL